MLFHIHTVVENSDNNDPGFRAGAAKDDMTALTELFVPWLYVIGIAANIRLASQQLESIVANARGVGIEMDQGRDLGPISNQSRIIRTVARYPNSAASDEQRADRKLIRAATSA